MKDSDYEIIMLVLLTIIFIGGTVLGVSAYHAGHTAGRLVELERYIDTLQPGE